MWLGWWDGALGAAGMAGSPAEAGWAHAYGQVRPLSYQDSLCSLSGKLGLLSQMAPLALRDHVESSGRLAPASLPPLGAGERQRPEASAHTVR